MNEIVSTSADAAVRYLLVGSIAAAILVPLAWLTLRATRLRAPVYRHVVWLYCLIGTVAIPAIWLHGPKLMLPVLPARAQTSEAPPLPQPQPQRVQMSEALALPQPGKEITVPLTRESPAVPVEIASSRYPAPRTNTISWKVMITGAWLTGFAVMLIRLVIGWLRLQSICRSATPVEPREFAGDLSSRRLEVRLTKQLEGPVCLGILRPVILLPEQMYQDASSKDLHMVLAHELAHIDRRDCWVNLFQRLLEAMFFFHSLVWLASRQLTHERERICDNWVLARGVHVDDYMQLLSEIGERILMKTRHLPAVALFEGGLLSRVHSLLDPQHNHITRMTRRSAWTCAISFLLCFAVLGTVRLGARPNPGAPSMPATAALLTSSGLSQAESAEANEPAFRPQEERVGPTERRPNGNSSLSGHVISADSGEPVDHATAYLFCIDTHDAIFIRVASDGSFLFKDIASGDYSLQTTHTTGYQDFSYNPEGRTGKFPPFTLRQGEQRTGIVLKPKPACNISGVVLDEDGNPLSSKDVYVVAWQAQERADGERFAIVGRTAGPIQAEGSYVLDGLDARPTYVTAVDWHAQDKDDGYPVCYHPGTLDRNKATMVTFDAAHTAENINIRLQKRGEYALEGTITDETTGNPIEKALVVIHHVDMLFDRVTTYTDAQGHYRTEALGTGEFLVHVDAKPFGFVRKRHPLTIDSQTKVSRLDFALKPGVTIRGKFVDAAGKDIEIGPSAYGTAHHDPRLNPQSESWSGVRNRYTVTEPRHAIFYEPGEGDYDEEHMDFPTAGTFLIEGMLPGQTVLSFVPKATDLVVQSILYKGQDVRWTGFDTGTDRQIEDITIVTARPTPPLPPR